MQKLGVVEDTLFIPMLGRIYASEHCPQVLYDKKALELKKKAAFRLDRTEYAESVYPLGLCFPVC